MPPVPSLALVILDGWGLAAARPRQRGLAGRDAGLRPPLGALPAHRALRPGPRRRPAGRPDGQLRGRPPQPRRRGDRQAGPGPDRRRDRRRQLLRERGAAGRLRAGARKPAGAAAPARPGLRRRRPLRLGAPRGDRRAGLPGGRARRRLPRLHRRPRHGCRTAAASTSPSWSAGCAPRAASPPSAAATTRWTATPAGSGSSSPTTRSSTPRGRRRRAPAEAIAASYERRRDRRVRPADRDRRLRRRRRGRRRDLRQLPPRPGAAR